MRNSYSTDPPVRICNDSTDRRKVGMPTARRYWCMAAMEQFLKGPLLAVMYSEPAPTAAMAELSALLTRPVSIAAIQMTAMGNLRPAAHGRLGEFDLAPESSRSPKPQIWQCPLWGMGLTAYSRPQPAVQDFSQLRPFIFPPARERSLPQRRSDFQFDWFWS